MSAIRHVLYATDFSSASRRAFKTAAAMAKASRARLTILHVIVPLVPLVPEQYLDPTTLARLDAETRRWSERRLATLADQAKRAGARAATLVRHGNPAAEIVRAARGARADLVVLGTHGRQGLSKFFVGSVASRVVATAPCPVVTVRGT
jgi:universal stress protein A